MKITKELIEEMVREALSEATEPAPAADMTSDDITRILTNQDMERINTKPEYIKALNMIVKHSAEIPQGRVILTNLYRELPAIIKKMR